MKKIEDDLRDLLKTALGTVGSGDGLPMAIYANWVNKSDKDLARYMLGIMTRFGARSVRVEELDRYSWWYEINGDGQVVKVSAMTPKDFHEAFKLAHINMKLMGMFN